MQRCNIFSSLHGVSKLRSPKQMVQRLKKTNKQYTKKKKKINDGCAIRPIGESLILLNKWYMIAFQLVFFLFSILYIAPWSIFLSRASEDTVNLARLQHCTYLSPSIILALTAALYVAVCNISWLISVDRAVLKRPRRVTLALLASLWRLSSHLLFPSPALLLLLRVLCLIADSCLWGLEAATSAKRTAVPGHWDFNNDLRETSTWELLALWRIGLKHKG